MAIAGEVAIIGSATTAFGVHHDRGYLDLLAEAAFGALDDAGLDLDRIGSAWLGTAEPGLTGLVGDSGGAVAEAIGFAPRPVTRVANFCCTGMEAVRAAALDVAAGEHELVLAIGAEKMRDVTSRGSLVARTANLTHPTIAKGRTAPGQFALLANAYMERWGTSRETLARVAVKNHEHATRNPKAHFRSAITVEDVLAAPLVAEPFGTLDCTPTTDGAAAVVLASVEWARANAEHYVVIRGFGLAVVQGYYTTFFDETNDFLGFRATREAAAVAYRQAGITDPARPARPRRVPRLLHRDRARQHRGPRALRPRRGRGAARERRDGLRRRHPGQRLGRPAVLRAPGRCDGRADDRGDRRPHPRPGRRAPGRWSAARRRAHAGRPGRRVDRLRRGGGGMSSLEERVQRLEDERAIIDRLYAYCTSLDYGHRDEWVDCWTEDGVLAWPHETFTGREEIGRAFDGHSHAPEAFHKHVIVDPRVRLNGDEATAQSYFMRLNDSPEGPVVRSFGRYLDVLVRCDDGTWRIRERRLERESLIPGAPVT